jgi:hypothetical protein
VEKDKKSKFVSQEAYTMRRDKGRGEVPSTNGKTGSQVKLRNDSITLRSLTANLQRETDGLEQKMKGQKVQICQSGGVHDAARQGTRRGAINERKQL